MAADLYLIVPSEIPNDPAIAAVRGVLAATNVAAMLVRRGERNAQEYGRLVDGLRSEAQPAGTAILIEGDPADVRRMGADGLHLAAEATAVRAAVKALKPEFIVGAGPADSRHLAMELGEAGVDYVLFGSLSGPISADQREMAQWWAETMEIPSVLSDPQATAELYDATGCEFIGVTLPLAGSPE